MVTYFWMSAQKQSSSYELPQAFIYFTEVSMCLYCQMTYVLTKKIIYFWISTYLYLRALVFGDGLPYMVTCWIAKQRSCVRIQTRTKVVSNESQNIFLT